ncbi:MAG: hypothetical protein ACT4PT_00670 [Methanobacteriota archaeon]
MVGRFMGRTTKQRPRRLGAPVVVIIIVPIMLAGCLGEQSSDDEGRASPATRANATSPPPGSDAPPNGTSDAPEATATPETNETATPSTNTTATERTTSPPGPEPCPAQAPIVRRSGDAAYFAGPLYDAHFHMPQFMRISDHPEAPVIDEDISRRAVICLFAADRVRGPFAFYGIPQHLRESALATVVDVDRQDPGSMAHFLEYVEFPGYSVDPEEIDRILREKPRLFDGYGEISLYLPHYSAVRPDDRQMQDLYRLAARDGLIVMMHPVESQRAAVETILREHPNVTFLFHGAEHLSWGPELFDRMLTPHPNARYSIDTTLYGMGERGPVLDSSRSPEDFAARLGAAWDSTLAADLARWKPLIEAHPDQFVWGTDRGGAAWHYRPEVSSILEEFSRTFIGRLDPSVQERFAFRNAEAMLAGGPVAS